jgi:hypothetical protein
MLRIELNKKEYTYLCKASFLDNKYKMLVVSGEYNKDKYLIKISGNQADKIRDLCGEQLQVAGFDEKYELTKEGEILESLIDKFFLE